MNIKQTIEELKKCIYQIEEIGWLENKKSEDYEQADKARNKAFELLKKIEKNIDD